jgi:hypothetical protein
MADALNDLPDPLDTADTVGGVSGTADPDDLLQQLADDAIDQLMQNDAAGGAPGSVTAAGAVTDLMSSQSSQMSDDAINVAPVDVTGLDVLRDAADQMPPPVDVPVDIAEVQDNVDADAQADVKADAHANTHAAADVNKAASAVVSIESGRTDVKALLDDALAADAEGANARVLLWPLRVMNAPFAGLGDGLRDVIGQIAIITLVNALAVLLYVILFRT